MRPRLVCECGVMVLYFARFTSLSALVILLVTTLLLATERLNIAVEFTGGMIIQVHYPEAVASKSVQDTLVRAGLADAYVKEISGYPPNFFIVFPPRDEVLSPQTAPLVVQRVIAALRMEQSRVEATRVEIVTPKIGGEVLMLGSSAPILVCVAIMIYPAVRYGWRVGLSLAATNIRNLVIALGLLLSAYVIFQWEFSLLSLTAVGFLALLVTWAGAIYASRARRF
jgi:preprotein translocase subunit SecF